MYVHVLVNVIARINIIIIIIDMARSALLGGWIITAVTDENNKDNIT